MTTESMETALKRYEIIAPLLSNALEPAEKQRLRAEIIRENNISERTLRRYLQLHKQQGFEGLITKTRSTKGKSKAISAGILQEAIEIRRELPERSVRRIIKILEGEGKVKPGEIAKSTLTRQLLNANCGAAQTKIASNAAGARRFQKQHRNSLWMTDLKFGPYIPGKNGKRVRTYLLAFIDDATRLVVHAEFYDNQKLPILEDGFRKSLLKFGIPDALYVDNGKIFISKWMRLACGRLGIKHLRCLPYAANQKGKIEALNRFAEELLQELSLEPPQSLTVLNQKLNIWLEEGYTNKEHAGINHKTPIEAWRADPQNIHFTSPEKCREVFLWEISRKVDKTGCLSLNSIIFDAGVDYISKRVDVRYDPFDLSVVEIWIDGVFQKKAEPLVMQEYLPKIQLDSGGTSASKPTHSRLLSVYQKQNEKRDLKRNSAISFKSLEEEGHV